MSLKNSFFLSSNIIFQTNFTGKNKVSFSKFYERIFLIKAKTQAFKNIQAMKEMTDITLNELVRTFN